jgi:hypothetical protein
MLAVSTAGPKVESLRPTSGQVRLFGSTEQIPLGDSTGDEGMNWNALDLRYRPGERPS